MCKYFDKKYPLFLFAETLKVSHGCTNFVHFFFFFALFTSLPLFCRFFFSDINNLNSASRSQRDSFKFSIFAR